MLGFVFGLFRPDPAETFEDELRRLSEADDLRTARMAARCNRVDLGVFGAGKVTGHPPSNSTDS